MPVERHADEAAADFAKEFSKYLGYRAVDLIDLLKGRGFMGLVTFTLGLTIPLIVNVKWPTLILILFTLGFWFNFIVRASFLAGIIGTIEGVLPIFQADKEMEGPVTNDGRIAAAYAYNFLSDAAAIFLLIMLIPVISPIPIVEVRFWYIVVVLMLLIAGILQIDISTKRIETVGGKPQKEKK